VTEDTGQTKQKCPFSPVSNVILGRRWGKRPI